MKYLLIAMLLLIVLSLADAMFYLARGSGKRDDRRVVKALTIRIGLSLALFLVAMLSIIFGFIEPHAVS